MTEEELELERRIDDDYNVINHYYRAKRLHPKIPFYMIYSLNNEKRKRI